MKLSTNHNCHGEVPVHAHVIYAAAYIIKMKLRGGMTDIKVTLKLLENKCE
jgi:hypothetical protein